MLHILSSVDYNYRKGLIKKGGYNLALTTCKEDPRTNNKKAIRSRVSSSSFSTATTMPPSTVNCATAGDYATWGGTAGARRLEAGRPPCRHHGLEENRPSPATQRVGWERLPYSHGSRRPSGLSPLRGRRGEAPKEVERLPFSLYSRRHGGRRDVTPNEHSTGVRIKPRCAEAPLPPLATMAGQRKAELPNNKAGTAYGFIESTSIFLRLAGNPPPIQPAKERKTGSSAAAPRRNPAEERERRHNAKRHKGRKPSQTTTSRPTMHKRRTGASPGPLPGGSAAEESFGSAQERGESSQLLFTGERRERIRMSGPHWD